MSTPTPIVPFVKAVLNFTSNVRLKDCLHSVPELIDFNATHNANHPFCIQAKSNAEPDIFTHGEFKVAAANCVQWLRDNVPLRETTDPKALTRMAPVALLMQSDVGLVIHEFALISLGVPPLVLSPRLSPPAIMHLLQTTGASSLIVSQRLSGPAKPALAALSARGLSTHIGASYADFHEPGVTVGSKGSFEVPQELDSVVILLHSSGTTGMPKPIPITHRQLVFSASCNGFETDEDAQGLNVSSLPMFHGFGLVSPGLSMSVGKTTVYPASDAIPNAKSLIELIKKTKAKSLMTVPFLLDDMVNNEEAIKVLSGLDFVGTGGAMLGAGVGDRLTAGGVKLLNFYGTTETGHLSEIFVPKDNYDWRYFRLRSDVKHTIAELSGVEGQRRFRLTVMIYGDNEGFEIADQLIRNEEYPETDFAAVGRDDDIIVLATGEKADPLILVTLLSDAPAVKSAVVFGDNRFNLGVIVEPTQPVAVGDEQAFKESIWPIIMDANQKIDGSARITSLDAVIVVPAGVVIPRTDKGSIPRREVYALFEKEIDAVYETLSGGAADTATGPLNLETLELDLKGLVEKHTKLQGPVAVEDSLFDLGLDSLQGLQLRRVLVTAVSKTDAFKGVDVNKLVPPQFLYLNSSIREMAAALTGKPAGVGSEAEPWKEVNKFVELFSLSQELVPDATDAKLASTPENAVVLLTGSSGSLGSHILASLGRSSQVKQVVIVLRKGASAFDKAALASKGLVLTEEESSKISTVELDPTAAQLGLVDADYKALQSNITHIIHAAWPMNYLTRLSSFQYQFKFLKSLLQLGISTAENRKRRFVFISSIATVAKIGLAGGGTPILEEAVDPLHAACGVGYADGKLVCEKLLEQAASLYDGQLEVTYVRCGQMTGARKTGWWNSAEQVPMLLRTAQSLGSLPILPGTLSWIPVDDAAQVILDVTLAAAGDGLPLVQHLENPIRQPWSHMIAAVGRQLKLAKAPIAFDKWLELVVDAGGSDEAYPVRQLSEFFKASFQAVACGQVVLDTTVACSRSKTLSTSVAVDDDLLGAYVRHWKCIGYLENQS
ncbi:unnamed protein product [Discula destructiva]